LKLIETRVIRSIKDYIDKQKKKVMLVEITNYLTSSLNFPLRKN